MKRVICAVVSAALVIPQGCATASKDVATTYVSPLQYQSYDCGQIGMELGRIQSRVTELGGRLDEASNTDKVLVGIGLVLFWPSLFFIGGSKQQEAEFGRLKGEYEALQQTAIAKKCSVPAATQTSSPAKPEEKPAGS